MLFKKNKEKKYTIPVRNFVVGEIVIHEGDRAVCMFDIQKGRVAVYKNYGKPTQKELAVLKEGDYFGEMAIIENQPRNATIVVLDEPTIIQVITADDFFEYVRQNPTKLMLMLQRMGRRISQSNDELKDACETIAEIDNCQVNGLRPSKDLEARIKMYANRYEKMK